MEGVSVWKDLEVEADTSKHVNRDERVKMLVLEVYTMTNRCARLARICSQNLSLDNLNKIEKSKRENLKNPNKTKNQKNSVGNGVRHGNALAIFIKMQLKL